MQAAFLFDCDGVLYHGQRGEPGAAEALHALQAAGKRVLFVTNSASRHRSVMAGKLRGLGMPDDVKSCYTSARAAAMYLQQRGVRRAFVVGTAGLAQELGEAGIEALGGGDFAVLDAETGDLPTSEQAHDSELEEDVGAVVVGYDARFTYGKLAHASALLRADARCALVGTNGDACATAANGRLCPAAGAILAAVEVGSGRKATIVGKPEQTFLRGILEDNGLDPSTTVMVGDRLDTDMKFGNDGGLKTLLVLSGVTEENAEVPTGMEPTLVAGSVAELAAAARAAALLPN